MEGCCILMVAQMNYQKRCDTMPFSGSRMRERRIAAGYKYQKDLAAAFKTKGVQISAKMISDYERGKEQPRADDLYEIAITIDTSTGYLCGESDVKEPLTISQMKNIVEYSVMHLFRVGKLSTAKLKLAAELRDLPESRQHELIRLISGE